MLVDIVTVPDRGAAFLVERLVLDAYSAHRADVGPAHVPQGGWTECWDVLAGEGHVRVNIGTSLERVREVVRRLHAAMA